MITTVLCYLHLDINFKKRETGISICYLVMNTVIDCLTFLSKIVRHHCWQKTAYLMSLFNANGL